MKRLACSVAILASLFLAGSARAALEPVALPQLLPPHLLTEVGAPVPPPVHFRSGFAAPTVRGYRITVYTYGSAVILEVWHGHRNHGAGTAYLARGVAAPQRLQATFGHFGRVSMRFRRTGKPKTFCRDGTRVSKRHGFYLGRFTFKGEGGYVSADLRRAKGTILEPVGHCRRHAITRAKVERELEAFFAPTSGLLATSREGVATSNFLGFSRETGSIFLASHEETRGHLAIIRIAVATASKGFHANEALTSATLKPPAPFHGTGRYLAAPDGTQTWGGNLSVNFPGDAHHPLTGPQYEVLIEVPF